MGGTHFPLNILGWIPFGVFALGCNRFHALPLVKRSADPHRVAERPPRFLDKIQGTLVIDDDNGACGVLLSFSYCHVFRRQF